MIWVTETVAMPASRFQDEVERDLLDMCPALKFDVDWCEPLAESITAYCERQLGSFELPLELYGLLIARVLWSVGRQDAAERALEKWCRAHVAAACSPFRPEGFSGARLWAICDAGMLRRGAWITMGGTNGWILDLDKLTISPDDALEIALYETMRRLVGAMVHLWDTGKGAGWLGIQGLEHMADGLSGKRTPERKRFFAKEMLAFSSTLLTWYGRRRDWVTIPEVKNLSI